MAAIGELPPLHFAVPVWGDAYIKVFLETCLPAQLSPNNLPGLERLSSCRYNIYTTQRHKDEIEANPTFKRLKDLLPVSIHYIETDGPDPALVDQAKKYSVKSDCYRSALADAVAAGAAIVLLNADILLADGFYAGIDRLLRSGYRALEVAGPRGLRDEISKEIQRRHRRRDGMVAIEPGDLAQLWIRFRHPLMDLHMMDGEPDEPFHPSHLYWPVVKTGILAHCFHLYPIMVFPRGETSFSHTIDNDLIQSICPNGEGVYIASDSDEFFCCELSPIGHYVGTPAVRNDVRSIVNFYQQQDVRNYSSLKAEIAIGKSDSDPIAWRGVAQQADSFVAEIFSEYGRCAGRTEVPIKPRRFSFLLAVWGEYHIDLFLNYALPSLLAPGNIPFLSVYADAEFVVLTRREDLWRFAGHPSIRKLGVYMPVKYLDISDLGLRESYGVLLTLAFARGIRYYGAKAEDTHFIFLNADFVFSNGSLRSLLRILDDGYRAVVAPSFRCVAEDFRERMDDELIPFDPVLSKSGRELARAAIDLMHDTFRMRVVNESPDHSSLVNQFLWKIDSQTYLGRFYLQFMLCIKPEVSFTELHGFCDYTFVPEFVPSGKVYQITNIDDAFLLELQKKNHETEHRRPGKPKIEFLIERLSEWSTALHRSYAEKDILIHAGDIPSQTGAVAAQAKAFIDEIHRRLPAPQPYRDHQYWTGTIAALKLTSSAIARKVNSIQLLNEAAAQVDYSRVALAGKKVRLISDEVPIVPSYGRLRPGAQWICQKIVRWFARRGIFVTRSEHVYDLVARAFGTSPDYLRELDVPLNQLYAQAVEKTARMVGDIGALRAALAAEHAQRRRLELSVQREADEREPRYEEAKPRDGERHPTIKREGERGV